MRSTAFNTAHTRQSGEKIENLSFFFFRCKMKLSVYYFHFKLVKNELEEKMQKLNQSVL